MKFYNTKSKSQQELIPLQNGKVKLYVCGPTVYATPHLGNARSAVIYDLLFRVLRTKYEVTYVRNITDVDDKINAAAKNNKEPITALTSRIIAEFHEIMQKLGCLSPTIEPKVTENIPEIIAVIEKLIANENAYVAEGHVLFDVNSDKNYGKLSNRSIDEMQAGARIEVAPYKKNPGDFVLWKPASKDDDASAVFQSPWGNGRPGWHIECTAMSTKFLGVDFDIHGGGADLTFPHHENEVAQATCAHKGSIYANMWIHNGFLIVNGEKMSKSLGNFITVHDLLEKGVSGEVIRLALLSSHYRGPLDWTEKLVYDSQKAMDRFYSLPEIDKAEDNKPSPRLVECLSDDLNFSLAIAYIRMMVLDYNSGSIELLPIIRNDLKFLGFLNQTPDEYFGRNQGNSEVEQLISLRNAAKTAKNYAQADQIRQQLLDMNIIIEDKPGGVTEWRKK